MMNYLSSGRNQRAKGFNIKQTLQCALLLSVSLWLVYQIRRWNDGKKGYPDSIRTKIKEGDGAVILGRKGNVGWLNNGGVPESEAENLELESVKKDDGDAGDDELVGNVEERALGVSTVKESSNMATPKEKVDQKDLDIEYKESQINETSIEETSSNDHMYEIMVDALNKSHENMLVSFRDRNGQGDENGQEREIMDAQRIWKDKNVTVLENKDVDVEENGINEVLMNTEKKMTVNSVQLLNATSSDQQENEEGFLSFHDVNGVPQDLISVPVSMKTEFDDDQRTNLHQGRNSNLSKRSKTFESVQLERDDFELREATSGYSDVESEVNIEELNIVARANTNIDSATIGLSSMNHISKTDQMKHIDTKDLASSQQELEKVTDRIVPSQVQVA